MFAFNNVYHAEANCAEYANKYMSCRYLMIWISRHRIDYYPPPCEELQTKAKENISTITHK